MKLISIEPTPSPNSMKLNVDETLPRGRRYSYSVSDASAAPETLGLLLQIAGVRSLFRTADFIALDRKPGADWAAILAEAGKILQIEPQEGGQLKGKESSSGYGEAQVLVQMYRGIPIQVRVQMAGSEVRSALPPQFGEAVSRAAGSAMIRERKLEEFGVRYGEPEDIAAEIVRELEASYTDERLNALIEAAIAQGAASSEEAAAPAVRPAPLSLEQVREHFSAPEWQVRYAALERYTPEPEGIPLLAAALEDDNASVRRLAVVYLGDLRVPEALPHLFTALRDRSSSVRRTAGDTLSDMGDPAAIGPMIEALGDKNKLVRWRAARFLYEAGDESCVDALRAAENDSEFEIQLQARMALERIERGEEAAGSVWQQMTAARGAAGSSGQD